MPGPVPTVQSVVLWQSDVCLKHDKNALITSQLLLLYCEGYVWTDVYVSALQCDTPHSHQIYPQHHCIVHWAVVSWSGQLQHGFTSYKYLQGFTIYLQICWKLGNWRGDLIFWHCVGVLAGELQKCRLEVSEYGIAFTFCFNFYVNLATLTSPCVTWWLNFHLKLITEHLGWGNLHNIFRV